MTVSYALTREISLSRTHVKMLGVFVFVVLLSVSAYIRIPLWFTPVPMTLQTLFVLLCSVALKRNYAPLAVGSYILLGALGAPVFQGYNHGITYLFGATGGYLLGFLACSLIVSHLVTVDRVKRNRFLILGSLLLGQISIYFFGVSWLMVLLGITVQKALAWGVMPFIPGAIFKLGIAYASYKKIFSKYE